METIHIIREALADLFEAFYVAQECLEDDSLDGTVGC